MRIDKAHQPIQLHQRVLEWRRGQQHFGPIANGGQKRAGDFVVFPINIAESMRLINDDKVPGDFEMSADFALAK